MKLVIQNLKLEIAVLKDLKILYIDLFAFLSFDFSYNDYSVSESLSSVSDGTSPWNSLKKYARNVSVVFES